ALCGVAVVASGAQPNAALLPHGVVSCVRSRSVKERTQSARLGVTRLDGPVILARRITLHHRGHVFEGERLVGRVRANVASPEAILQIRHHPGSGTGAFAPDGGGAEVDRFRSAFAVVSAVSLHVAIIEAAARVVNVTRNHHVLCLGVVTSRGATGLIVAISNARHQPQAICGMVSELDRTRFGVCFVTRGEFRPAARCLGEVIAPSGLIVNDRDGTRAVGAEAVLGSRVGKGSRSEGSDVVGFALSVLDLIEWPGIRGIQGSNRAVRRDAGAPFRRVDVARALRRSGCGWLGWCNNRVRTLAHDALLRRRHQVIPTHPAAGARDTDPSWLRGATLTAAVSRGRIPVIASLTGVEMPVTAARSAAVAA